VPPSGSKNRWTQDQIKSVLVSFVSFIIYSFFWCKKDFPCSHEPTTRESTRLRLLAFRVT
jgi:hypothetical protein